MGSLIPNAETRDYEKAVAWGGGANNYYLNSVTEQMGTRGRSGYVIMTSRAALCLHRMDAVTSPRSGAPTPNILLTDDLPK